MRFGLILPSFSFPDLDYAKAARLRAFAVRAEVVPNDPSLQIEAAVISSAGPHFKALVELKPQAGSRLWSPAQRPTRSR